MPSDAPSPFVGARWMWADMPSWDLTNCYALFRLEFKLEKIPRQAPLFVTADQAYKLYLNGQYVCRGPARGFQAHWPYDEIDVAPYLRSGTNVIGVRGYHPGCSNFQYISQQWAGVLVAARWGKFTLRSNADWRCRRQNGVSKNTVPTSLQLFPQEHIDARIETWDWLKPGFNDAAWVAPTLSGAWNSMPWYTLEPRGIPLLREQKLRPKEILGQAEGTCADGYPAVRDVTLLRHQEGMAHRPPRKKYSKLKVPATGADRFRSYLIDFGRVVVGNLSFRVAGAEGGEIIDTLHVETIDEATLTPDLVLANSCHMAFGYRLICRRGRNEHAFFHAFGFRYVVVTIRNSTKALEVDLDLDWIGYPIEPLGSFQSSETDLEGIWQISAWTQQCCSLDAFVDTPWREQAQWWGDARVQAWNTFHLSGDARLFRRGIAQISAQTLPNGLTYGHAPTIAHNCILPDFSLIWILTLWDYYWQTGSIEPFLAHQHVLKGVLDYFRAQTSPETGLVAFDDRYWLFQDWAPLFEKEGYPAVLNLWLLDALEKITALYETADLPDEARQTRQWRKRLKASLVRLIDEKGFVRDGLTFSGTLSPILSVHAQTLALMTVLDPKRDRPRLEHILLPYLQGSSGPAVEPSAYWVTYVLEEMSRLGYGREVIDFIRRKWTRMIPYGSTWENWDPARGDGSRSHAWSAHPLFHLMRILGGVSQTAPAWKEVLFAPVFLGQRCAVTLPTPQGIIKVEWKIKNGMAAGHLFLPMGMTALVRLPGREKKRVAGRFKFDQVDTTRES